MKSYMDVLSIGFFVGEPNEPGVDGVLGVLGDFGDFGGLAGIGGALSVEGVFCDDKTDRGKLHNLRGM